MSRRDRSKTPQNNRSTPVEKIQREPALFLINPLDLKELPAEAFSCYMDALQILSMNYFRKDFDGTAEAIDNLEVVITSVDFFLVVSGLVQGLTNVKDYISKAQYKPKDAREWIEFLRPSQLARMKAIAEYEYQRRVDERGEQPLSSIQECRRTWAEEMDEAFAEGEMCSGNTPENVLTSTMADIVKRTINNVPPHSSDVPQKKKKTDPVTTGSSKAKPTGEARSATVSTAATPKTSKSVPPTVKQPEKETFTEKEWKRRRAHRTRPLLPVTLGADFRRRVGDNVSKLACSGIPSDLRTKVADTTACGQAAGFGVILPGLTLLPIYLVNEINSSEHFVEEFVKWRTAPSYVCTTHSTVWEQWPEALRKIR